MTGLSSGTGTASKPVGGDGIAVASTSVDSEGDSAEGGGGEHAVMAVMAVKLAMRAVTIMYGPAENRGMNELAGLDMNNLLVTRVTTNVARNHRQETERLLALFCSARWDGFSIAPETLPRTKSAGAEYIPSRGIISWCRRADILGYLREAPQPGDPVLCENR